MSENTNRVKNFTGGIKKQEKKDYEMVSAVRKVPADEIASFSSKDEYAVAIKQALVHDISNYILSNTKTLPVTLSREVHVDQGIEEYVMSLVLVYEKRLVQLLNQEIELQDLYKDIDDLRKELDEKNNALEDEEDERN